MAAPANNLFLRLRKWATRQDENFLTEALAVVLEQLLVLAPDIGTRLIAKITGGFIEVAPEDAGAIQVRTQVEAGAGRPDLEISIPYRLVWIEVKAESELRRGQLEGYRILLNACGVTETRLVLLTRYPQVFQAEAERPDLAIRWFEVAGWFDENIVAAAAAGEAAGFLTRQFLDFLGARGMTLTQVGKYMPDGLRAWASLLNMLFEAAAACKVSAKLTAERESIGVKIDGRKYWVGVNYDTPETLWFATLVRINPEAAAKLGVGELSDQISWIPGRYQWARSAELDSETIHFFSRAKVGQMEWLESFLRESLIMARSIESPDQQPIPEEPEGQ